MMRNLLSFVTLSKELLLFLKFSVKISLEFIGLHLPDYSDFGAFQLWDYSPHILYLFTVARDQFNVKMVSAKQIRDGLFYISWNTPVASVNQQQTVEVKHLKVFFKFCRLCYSRNGGNAIFDIEIHFFDATNPIKMRKMRIEVSKNGVKQKMTIISPSKWTASWNETTCQYCSSLTQCINFDILIDLTLISPPKKKKKHQIKNRNREYYAFRN